MATISSYKAADGSCHWPNASLGSSKYYGVEWDTFLTAENDNITAISWTVPAGLTNMAESQASNQARIKLSADTIGKYEILCEINTVEGGETQTFIQKMNLEVV